MFSQVTLTTSPTNRDQRISLVEGEPRQQFISWRIPRQLTLVEDGINVPLRISQAPAEGVITNLKMPIINGLPMLRTFRQRRSYQASRFVVNTGLPLDAVQQQNDLLPVVRVISKPVDFTLSEHQVRASADEFAD